MKLLYSDNFYKYREEWTRPSAHEVLSFFFQYYKPQSICDVGCGNGVWLSEAKKLLNKIKLRGYDGDYVNKEYLLIDNKEFYSADLSKTIPDIKKYELVMSLEVAEHLPSKRAESFVDDLVCLGDVILFSAAVPHQIGKGHINEQPLSYWVSKFEKRGYIFLDIIRPNIWNNKNVRAHYKQNIVVFVRRGTIYEDKIKNIEVKPVIDMIHPEVFHIVYETYYDYYNCFFGKLRDYRKRFFVLVKREGIYGIIRKLQRR